MYAVVAPLAFGESAIFLAMVLPGETAMVVAGVLAAHGNISLPTIIAVCTTAAAGRPGRLPLVLCHPHRH